MSEPFAIPGLMPVESPNYEEITMLSARGLMHIPIYEADDTESEPRFIIGAVHSNLPTVDVEWDKCTFKQRKGNKYEYAIIINRAELALPYGTLAIEVLVNDEVYKRILVRIKESAISISQAATLSNQRPDNAGYFVIDSDLPLVTGTVDIFVNYYRTFGSNFRNIAYNIIRANDDLPIVTGEIIRNTPSGFEMTFSEAIPAGGYTLIWAAWN